MAKQNETATLGLGAAIALGVGGTIGGGIFSLIGVAVKQAGPGALMSFGLAFGAALLLALCYTDLSVRIPRTGGGYAISRAVLGPGAGFLMGWGYWGAYVVASGYTTLGFGNYLSALTGWPPIPAAMALVLLLTGINLFGIRVSARVLTVLVVIEIAVLALVAAAGVDHLHGSTPLLALPEGWAGVFTAAVPAFLAFGGFDQIAVVAGNIRRPQHTLPRAIFGALSIVLVLYLGLLLGALGTLPWRTLASTQAPLVAVAMKVLGTWGATLIAMTALVTTMATTNALVLVTSRVWWAMAADGYLPRAFARRTKMTDTPVWAVIFSGVFMATVAWIGNLTIIAEAAGFMYTATFGWMLAAWIRARRDHPVIGGFEVKRYGWVLAVAATFMLFILSQTGISAIVAGIAWLSLGAVFYALFGRRYGLSASAIESPPDV